jgi:DNA primase small subunit
LREHFETDILVNQDPWSSEERASKLLDLLPDKSLNNALRNRWESAPDRSSVNKWADINSVAESGVSKTLDTKALRDARQDIVLEYTYPRLDAEVSKRLNHLLKSPFCVHPGTGRVCVPIDTRNVESFDPLGVPTVSELLSEIDAWDSKNGNAEKADGDNAKRLQDWEKTSLKPYVELFRGFVNNLIKDEKPVKRAREEGDPMEF